VPALLHIGEQITPQLIMIDKWLQKHVTDNSIMTLLSMYRTLQQPVIRFNQEVKLLTIQTPVGVRVS
jgi:hypothetical protein